MLAFLVVSAVVVCVDLLLLWVDGAFQRKEEQRRNRGDTVEILNEFRTEWFYVP